MTATALPAVPWQNGSSPLCVCLEAVADHEVAWRCRKGHRSSARLCLGHAQLHASFLASSGVACGACRRDGREVRAYLTEVDGKRVSPREGRSWFA